MRILRNPVADEGITPDGIPLKAETPKVETTSEVKPEIKEEVKPEVKEEKQEDPDFDLSAFDAIKNSNILPLPKKEEVKPDSKPEVKVRDLADIAPEHQPLFKQMSNEAFEKLKPIYLENKKTKEELAKRAQEVEALKANRLPDNYYEHPESVVLLPEYKETSRALSIAKSASDHWTRQFQAIEEGAEEIDELDMDEQGRLFVPGKTKVTPLLRAEIIKRMGGAENVVREMQGRVENLVTGHKAKHSEAVGWLKNYETSLFPLFDKPEGEKFKPVIQDTINRFPTAFRSNPLLPFLAKSMLTIQNLVQIANGMKAQLEKAPKVPSTEKQNLGPSSQDTIVDVSSKDKGGDVTMDDFNRVKAL